MENENTFWLRLTGKVNIAVPLDVDTEYQYTGRICVYGEDKKSKNDGTYNVTFAAQFVDEIHLIKGEQVILGEKKSSASQKWRRLVEGKGYNYDAWMAWQFRKFDELEEEYAAHESESTQDSHE